MACIGDGSVLAGGRSIVANRYLEETTDPSCSFWNLPNIWILLLLLLWLCAYYCLNKEREGVQFSELGMGTTALQDGSLPACTRSCPSCKAFLLSSSPIGGDFSATQGPLARRRERLMGAEALYWCRWFSQGKESSSVAGGGVSLVSKARADFKNAGQIGGAAALLADGIRWWLWKDDFRTASHYRFITRQQIFARIHTLPLGWGF